MCADPGVPENGFRTPSEGVFFESSVTRFHCQDGFKLKGSTKRLCMKHLNGTLGWIPSDKPICVQEGKVLQPAPLPLLWTPLPWSACPCVASGPRPCVPEGSASGAAVCFGASPARGQSSPCVSRGPGQQINHLGVIVFLLYRHYNPTYRCSCQCEIATQTTVALLAPWAANAGLLSPRLSRKLGECIRRDVQRSRWCVLLGGAKSITAYQVRESSKEREKRGKQ